jgi:D-3-phosphoglycerate dehydrogenase
VIILPHLGASTDEAEENCAIMVADQVREYLENGTIHNSVNFPDVAMPHSEGHRLLVINSNVPGMIERISAGLAKSKLNILNMLNKSRGNIACTLVDVNQSLTPELIDQIKGMEGVLTARAL